MLCINSRSHSFKHRDSDSGCITVGPVHFHCVCPVALLCRTALQIFFFIKTVLDVFAFTIGKLKKKKGPRERKCRFFSPFVIFSV